MPCPTTTGCADQPHPSRARRATASRSPRGTAPAACARQTGATAERGRSTTIGRLRAPPVGERQHGHLADPRHLSLQRPAGSPPQRVNFREPLTVEELCAARRRAVPDRRCRGAGGRPPCVRWPRDDQDGSGCGRAAITGRLLAGGHRARGAGGRVGQRGHLSVRPVRRINGGRSVRIPATAGSPAPTGPAPARWSAPSPIPPGIIPFLGGHPAPSM